METAEPESAATEPLMPEPWVVRKVIRETEDTRTLVLEPGDGVSPMRFSPGQFNMLYAFGVGEVPISMSGDPADESRLVHTIRDVGTVTHALCNLHPGGVVGVRGPFGSHWPVADFKGRDVVVAAGGIGLAPLRPALYHVMQNRDQYDDVVLLYGARNPGELLYPGEFDAWRKAGIQVEVTVDNADRAWQGHVGVVTTLIRHGKFDVPEASALICGPEVMMRFTADELVNRGVDPAQVFISMERNMKCAIGFCGHCQLGPEFICIDGPVFDWPRMRRPMLIREL
jgi:NAD(P)H-flavin reductase